MYICSYWRPLVQRFDLRICVSGRLCPHLLRLAEDGVTKKVMPAV